VEISLAGRTALITGGSAGLGYAMAEVFAEAGARVAIVARNEDRLQAARDAIARKTGAEIHCWRCDVTSAVQIADVHADVERSLGSVGILINNAGQSQARPFEEIDDALWQADIDLKLFAAIRLTRLVWPGMKAQRWGRVLNLLNVAAKAPPPRSAPTSVTRAAGMALTKVLAGEGAPHNVLVNALLIGSIESDQIRRAHERSGADVTYDEFLRRAGERLPMGRVGAARECANLACFLVSDAASYVTGCAINVDGGLSRVV
jgi:3-oxoacyl-[acyl-carrier protein] reductase